MDASQKANYAAQSINQGYNAQANATTTAPVTASEGIINRLNSIRMGFAEIRSNSNHAAEKIVGSAPTPLAGAGIAPIKGDHPPACCFIDALQQVIGDLENILQDTQENLNRLHRSF